MITLSKNRDHILKCMMTVLVIVVAFIRQPELLIEPRFWAEEGTNFFSYAYGHNVLENLISPQFGYNTLYNSIATSMATMVPLEYAPYVTTYLAFFVQVSVSAAVIWWDIPVLDSLFKKFAIALFIQILAYARIWVTTIGVQYWLCILSFLILLYNENAQSRAIAIQQQCVLILNGLTGILSCLLIPAFALKYMKTRSKRVLTQLVLLSVCLLIQGAIFLYAFLNNDPTLSSRFGHCDFLHMLDKLIKYELVVPFCGQVHDIPLLVNAEIILVNVISFFAGPSIYSFQHCLLEVMFGLSIIGYLILLAFLKRRHLDTQLILISLISVTVVSTHFSINSSGGPRYTFAPSIMIMILIIGSINDSSIPKFLSYCALLLVLQSLTISCYQYRAPMRGLAYDPSWPKWKEEISIRKSNQNYPIKIWPPPWQITLPDM